MRALGDISVVGEVREKPTRQKMSLGRARRQHASAGYREYVGPKLEGPRFELDIKDEQFPEALRRIPRPPQKIYGIGSADALQEGLAIVGARKATPYGKECAKRFGRIAAGKGIVIISGGARGCDSEAHKAALSMAAPTVVIFGGGCDYVYPAENYDLFQRVINCGGAVISENEWGFPAMPYSFRERNRLIAGLARATLIVEAGLPSGTFSTADEALAAAKEVLAVPGAITSKTSRGANRLIFQGATPVVDDESFEDVLFSLFGCLKFASVEGVGGSNSARASGELADKMGVAGSAGAASDAGVAGVSGARGARGAIDAQFKPVFDAISARPTSIDEMCELVSAVPAGFTSAIPWLLVHLERLETGGVIVRLPDGRYAARV